LTIQVLNARAQAISLEDANPRHEHEWAVFQAVRLPDDKILTTGVLDSTTNFIEHPELVAQRLVRYAEVWAKKTSLPAATAVLPHAFAPPSRLSRRVSEPNCVPWPREHNWLWRRGWRCWLGRRSEPVELTIAA